MGPFGGEGRKDKAVPLKARHLSRPRVYIANSLRFSGRTSWPGGWPLEKAFRYPARISIAFSVTAWRISLSVVWVIRLAAYILY